MISASPIAGCPSFKFLTMQMQPSASCARMWTVLSATIMFADKPHRLNERAIAQRFRALALFGRDRRVGECLLLREERKSVLRGPISVFDPLRTYRNQNRPKWPRREALRLNYGSPFVTVKGLNPRSARAAHEAAPRCGNRK